MRVRISFFLMLLALYNMACEHPDRKKLLQGSWKTDSVHTYYNGFGFTRRDLDEAPLHHYEPDGKLEMTREQESRFFLYSMPTEDSLIHQSLDKKNLGRFLILTLNENQLVLKKETSPLFPGKGQERYEIRYFSRTK